jgi:hypothetical protein
MDGTPNTRKKMRNGCSVFFSETSREGITWGRK